MSYGRRSKTGNSMTGLRLYGVLSALALLLFCASPALGATLNVPGDYATIQGAIAAAVDGDEVVVQPGTYPERINFLGKAITVTGTNPDDPQVVADTIIDGQQSGTVVTFWWGESADSVLTGFTITNGKAPEGGGILCNGSSPTITNNVITENSATATVWYSAGGGGICCMNSSSPEISENIVSRNTAYRGGGIACRYSSSPDITGNTISDNSSTWDGAAISAKDGSAPAIRGNRIVGNTVARWGAGGVLVYDADGARVVVIEDNVFTGNTGGGESPEEHGSPIHVSGCSASIKRNVITENVSGGHAGGILCQYVTDVEIIANVVEDNQANNGGGIVVAGVSGPARIEGNQIRRNRAGFAGGLQLTRGTFIVEGNEITDNVASAFLGGISVQHADATLRFNTIERNTDAQGYVGGVWCYYSTVAILENTIASNVGVGVSVGSGTGVTIRGNSMFANEGLGIDLGGVDGVTLNDDGDADTGPNNLQNFPVILSATGDGASITIDGYLDSTPGTDFTLDFYANTKPDPSGYGEGETPIGSAEVTTGGDGRVDFEVTLAVAVQWPALTTATATDPDGNTSEFSNTYAKVLSIDIKPGSDPNSINLGAEGVVPVAILSTPKFDAASVDASSLVLSGSAVRLKGKSGNAGSLEDVDGDGLLDLVVQFYIDELALQEGSTEAALAGSLLDVEGTPIVGYDSVNVVP